MIIHFKGLILDFFQEVQEVSYLPVWFWTKLILEFKYWNSLLPLVTGRSVFFYFQFLTLVKMAVKGKGILVINVIMLRLSPVTWSGTRRVNMKESDTLVINVIMLQRSPVIWSGTRRVNNVYSPLLNMKESGNLVIDVTLVINVNNLQHDYLVQNGITESIISLDCDLKIMVNTFQKNQQMIVINNCLTFKSKIDSN